MMRNSLAAAVAVAPLLAAIAANHAGAETQITTSTTAPVATATVKSGAADDITITSGGQIAPTTSTPAVTLNSSNSVKNEGVITTKDVDGSVGILMLGGNKGSVTSSGSITITESYTATDSDSDGFVDGPWAKGTDRYGIRVIGPGDLDGSITNTGPITVQGNDSFGISIETGLTGSLIDQGVINITGDNTAAIIVTDSGSIDGDVKIGGATTARGAGTVGVEIDGGVGGTLNISSAVTASGYRSVTRPTSADTLKKLTADEMQQGGTAVTVAANVDGGIIVSAPPSGTSSTDTTTDADGDGVVDSKQTTGSVISYGSAPALQIGAGGGEDVTIGAVDLPTAGGYGLIIQGTVGADGVYDKIASPNLPAPVSATAIQIGVSGGGVTTITGGIHNAGTVIANAYGADATAIHMGSGATTSKIVNGGSITTTSTTAGSDKASAILIDSGATVDSITNTGTISANLRGSIGSARAITDASGAVKTIDNTGIITAAVTQTDTTIPVTGTAIAIDVSASTTGVTITQTKSTATGATDPGIIGAILFGSGDDTFNIQAGTETGALVFGDGADTLTIGGDAVVTAVIFDSDGNLAVNVDKGTLSVSNADVIHATSVNVGATSLLQVAADPANSTNTQFVTSGASTFASGAEIGLTLQSLQLNTTKYTILTSNGTLTTGTFGAGTLSGAPFLYAATASADATHVYLTVERKTAAQLGFSASEAAAYDAVFNALLADTDIQKAFLSQTTQASLLAVYDQMLPDQGLGLFEALDSATQSISNLTGTTPDAGVRQAGTSLWVQEVNERVHRDAAATLGSSSRLFGLAGGYEHMGAGGGALGLSLAYLNVQENDAASAVGEHVVASLLEGGAYYRRAIGGLRFSVRGAGGFVWFSGDRWFVSPGVQRHSESTWRGTFADAHAGLGYEAHFGRFYARPELSLDYLYLKEDPRTESGGGAGFDLNVEGRKSSRLSGEAIMVVGGQWGRETWLRPEIRAGYRHIFSGEIGDTVASFTGGNPFTLGTGDDKGGWVTVGFSVKGGTSLSYVALEGDADFRDGEQRYDLRLAGRSMF